MRFFLSLLLLTIVLYIPVANVAQNGESVVIVKNVKVRLSSRGILSISLNDIDVIGDVGFAAWGKQWSGFVHQTMSGEGISISHEETKEYIRYIIKTKLTNVAPMTILTNVTVFKDSGVILINATGTFDSDCQVQGLAWGAWGLPANLFAGKYITVFEFGSSKDVQIPAVHKSGENVLYSGSAVALLISYGSGSIGVVFLSPVDHVSIEDEREWGSNTISFRGWFNNELKSYKKGDTVSISVFLLPNIGRFDLVTVCSALYNIKLVRGLVSCSTKKEEVLSLLNKAWQSLLSYKLKNATAYADEAYKLVLKTVRTPYKFKWLHTNGTWIVDEDGYYVLLRGVDYMGMEFGWFNHKEEDFARISNWGFDVVRLPIGWTYIEPEPGKYNEEYLKLIDRVILWCKLHGLYVVLDMHQWRWGPKFKGCGMPDWLTPNANTEAEAAKTFFYNSDLWKKLAAVWKLLALRYKDEPAIAAYDIFNEPPLYSGMSLPDFTKQVTMFYSYMINEIRKVDKRHILMYEPVWGGLYEGTPMITGHNIILSIHTYIGGTADGVTGYEKTTYSKMEYEIRRWVSLGRRLDIPIWVGEYGVGSGAYKAKEWARDMTSLFDKYVLGYAWWTYWRDEKSFGLLYPNGTEKKQIVDMITRPLPARSSAPIYTMHFDVDKKVFICIYNATSKNLISYIKIPLRHYPDFPNGYDIQCNQTDFSYEWNDTTHVLKIVVKNPEGFTCLIIKPKGVKVSQKEIEKYKPPTGGTQGPSPSGGGGTLEQRRREVIQLIIYLIAIFAIVVFITLWVKSMYKKPVGGASSGV